MCIFVVLLVNKYLSSSELELILINIKRNNNYYYIIKTSFVPIYDTTYNHRRNSRGGGLGDGRPQTLAGWYIA